jgi:drug/metabolite transporter (DMT)-like permease
MATSIRPAHGLKQTSARWRAYLFLLINTLCWGAGLVIVKPSLEFTTPFRFLLYRYAIAAILALGFIWQHWRKIKRPYQAIAAITKLELIGVTLTLGLLYTGLSQTTAITANLITTTLPIFVTVTGILLLREREERHEWLGLGVAFLGTVFLVCLPIWQQGFSAAGFSLTGNLLIILSNVTVAIYYILAKKQYRNWPKLFVAAISFWVGLVSFFLLSLGQEHWQVGQLWQTIIQDWQHPAVWIASGYMAIFGSIIGLTAYIQGQNDIEASEAGVFAYLQPLVYLPLSVWLLHEQLGWGQIIALGVILVGVVLTETRRRVI